MLLYLFVYFRINYNHINIKYWCKAFVFSLYRIKTTLKTPHKARTGIKHE